MRRLIAWLSLVIAAPAYANAQDFSSDLAAIPMLALLLVFSLAMVGALTSVMLMLSKEPPAIELRVFPVLKAIWMSEIGGFIGFAGALAIDASPPLMSIMVFGTALAGASALEALRDRMTANISRDT